MILTPSLLKNTKSIASNKSDVRRPLCCAADDDPFPLPDYLSPIADRPQVNIRRFVDTPIPTPPPIPQLQSQKQRKEEQKTQELKMKQEHHPHKPSTQTEHLLRTAIVAELQAPPRVSPPNPLPPPTLSTLLQHLPLEHSSAPPQNSTILSVAIYNSQSPTKSANLHLPVTTPLMTLINIVPCTARPNLADTPSPYLLYVGNTLYHHTLPRRANYATSVQDFLRKNSLTTPPNLEPITPTSPTIEHLTLTLGVPYPLLHHADCEHLLIFTDLFRSYQQNPAPIIHHRLPQLTPCDVCRRRAADRFTVADLLADSSPFHYCANCFREAHYSQHGQMFKRSERLRVFPHHNPI